MLRQILHTSELDIIQYEKISKKTLHIKDQIVLGLNSASIRILISNYAH